MSVKKVFFAVGALALAACAEPTEPRTVDEAPRVEALLTAGRGYNELAFTRYNAGTGRMEIWKMDVFEETSHLISPSSAGESQPDWNPAGDMLAFVTGTGSNATIWVREFGNDWNFKWPLRACGSGNSYDPAWSRDGLKIAFTSTCAGNSEIYVMNHVGGGETRLTFHPSSDFSPAWSPDRKKIAFTSLRDSERDPHVYIMNADRTGVPTRLTNMRSEDPVWHPGANRITFVSGDGIYEMNADGTGVPTRLISGARQPAWTYDGTSIAYVRGQGLYAEIFVARWDGTGERQLTSNWVYDGEPTFRWGS